MADHGFINQLCAILSSIVFAIFSAFQKFYVALINLLSGMASFFQQQKPPLFFTHEHFGLAMFVILGLLKLVYTGSPPILSNPVLYYVAVASFISYIIAASAVGAFSTSNLQYNLPSWAIYPLSWCMYFAGILSFSATASFLFPSSVRLAIFFSLLFFIIFVVALLYWVYNWAIESRWDRWNTNMMHYLARLSGEQSRQVHPRVSP